MSKRGKKNIGKRGITSHDNVDAAEVKKTKSNPDNSGTSGKPVLHSSARGKEAFLKGRMFHDKNIEE